MERKSGSSEHLSTAEIHAKKLALARSNEILCTSCNTKFNLGNADFVQDHFFSGPAPRSPFGRWEPSQVHTCSLRCPLCKNLNYIYTHPQSQLIIILITFLGLTEEELFSSILDRKGEEIHSRKKGPVIIEIT